MEPCLGGVPVYLHALDRAYVMRPDDCLVFWEGDAKPLIQGMTLVRAGGHFEGASILHCAHLAAGKGALLTGDVLQVVPDGEHVAFMRSYPNYIPLGKTSIQNIDKRIEKWSYDAIYGAWWDRVIASNGKKVLEDSVARHVHWLGCEDV